MRKNAGRTGAAVAALAMGLAMSPAIANAEDAPVGGPGLQIDDKVLAHLQETYQDDGPIPVAFWAEGNDNCEVTFTVANRTQSDRYLVDYLIDDEQPPAEITDKTDPNYGSGKVRNITLTGGPYENRDNVVTRTIGRVGVVPAKSDTEPKTQYTTDNWLGDAKETTNTVKLRDLTDLPNPEADEHTITYQQVNGPVHGDFGIQSDLPVFSTKVTGCATPEPEPEDSGSLGSSFGSMFGSLFGSLGSNDAKLGSS